MSIKLFLGSKEAAKQFKGLPSTVYVNSHLLKAAVTANKIIDLEFAKFDHSAIRYIGESKEDLDVIGNSVEFRGVKRLESDGSWQRIDQSKLYDLEKYGKVSSDLKRRSLTKKGSKRYFDAVICYWFHANNVFIAYDAKHTKEGTPYLELVLDNSSSPKSYSIWFRVQGLWYHILLKGSGSDRMKHKKRKTGRTSNKTVTAEVTKTDSSQGSKSVSTADRYRRALQSMASISSAQPSSSGPSCPGE
jgi:hypothetical protein